MSESNDYGNSLSGLSSFALLPFTVAGVFTVVNTSSVSTALVALFGGATGFASVITAALWVIGVISIGFYGLVAVATVVLLLGAIFKSDRTKQLLCLGGVGLSTLYFVVVGGAAVLTFGQFHILVAFTLASMLTVYLSLLAIAVLFLIVGVAAF